jgi:Ca-activated chloride channel homolog
MFQSHRLIMMTLLLLLMSTSQAASEAVLWLQGPGDGQPSQALALETDVEIEVTGLLAHALVSQRFFNDSGGWAEGRYVFPLPDDSAVESLSIRIGERLIEGEIQPRGQARQTYSEARRDGRVAGLVEQERANVFTTSVANIPPGEEVEIRIGFRPRVDFEHGRFSLRFPTTIAPRYIPGQALPAGLGSDEPGGGWSPDTDRVPDASRITPPVQHPDGPMHNPLRLGVSLRAGVELAALESSFHAVRTELQGDRWRIELDEPLQSARRDFELTWRPAGQNRIQSAAFRQQLGGSEHVLLMVLPPEQLRRNRSPRELILIIDTSGSMRGEPMVQARDSLLFALDSLGPQDRFNVIEFNHLTRSLFDAPVTASNRNINQARRFVGALEAGGGTVMGPSLARAMEPAIPDGYLRQILFVTDGIIGNEQEVLDQIRRDVGHSRLFTVGIGHGVNSQFLRDGARFGRGSYTFIGDTAQIHARMSELITQLTSPVLQDIEVHWPGAVEAVPESIPDLYAGQPLMVTARADHLAGEVTVSGRSEGLDWQTSIPLDAFQVSGGVAAHWGRAALDQLLNQGRNAAERQALRPAVEALAVEYQLLSPFTSLVAVDRTPARSRQVALRRHEVPSNLPAGRQVDGFFSSARPMPATDAGSDVSLLRGLLALLLVGLLLGHKRICSEDEDLLDEEEQA